MSHCSGCSIALKQRSNRCSAELHQYPSRHPELLYRELARLAGSLLTFSLNIIWKQPRYRHALARAGIPTAVCPAGYAARSQPVPQG